MPDAPTITPLGASTLNRDWRVEIDTGTATGGSGTATATSGSASLSQNAHGLVANQPVSITSAVTPFVVGTVYYVSAAGLAANTFQLAATPGGAPIQATAAGSLVYSRGPVWTIVRGKRDFKPGIDANLEDDGDMDGGGWDSKTKTAAAWMLEFKVARKLNAAGQYDAGQEALRLAADQFGPPNSVSCRWYKVGSSPRTEAYQGYAAVEWSPEGGELGSTDEASVKLSGQGLRQSIPHPYTLP